MLISDSAGTPPLIASILPVVIWQITVCRNCQFWLSNLEQYGTRILVRTLILECTPSCLRTVGSQLFVMLARTLKWTLCDVHDPGVIREHSGLRVWVYEPPYRINLPHNERQTT